MLQLRNLVHVSAAFALLAAVQIASANQIAIGTKPSLSPTPLNQNEVIRIGVSLAGFQKARADAFVESLTDPTSSNFHRWMDTFTFGQLFGAPSSDVATVTQFLSDQGLTDIRVGAACSYISASGTFSQIGKAFGTTFANFQRPASLVAAGEPPLFYGPQTAAKIPPTLGSMIGGVFGLSDLSMAHPDAKIRKTPFPGYSPAQIAQAYSSTTMEATYKGAGMNIAIYSPTTRYLNDPTTFAAHFGIPDDFTIYDFEVDGGPLAATNGASEAALDQEIVIGQAPSSRVFMIEPPNTQAGEIDGFDSVGVIGSIPVFTSSWARDESTLIAAGETAFATSFENVCEALCASGVTILHGAGDTAAYDGEGTGVKTVKMEAACPYVTAIGGTTLTVNTNGTYGGETLWGYTGTPTAPKGGGGGISAIFKMPNWQTGYGIQKAGISNGYRELPDVSSDANPTTGYYIVVDGVAKVIGGCSSGGPLWGANLLLMEQFYATRALKPVRLGNINPAIYEMGNWFENPNLDVAGQAYVFNDITTGTNGVYSATIGYDMCAGFGSANFTKAASDLGYASSVPTFSPEYKPYTAPGWTSPVMIHATTSAVTEPTSFVHGTKYFVAMAGCNNGDCDGPAAPFALTVNGTIVARGTLAAMAINGFSSTLNTYTYTFPSAGTYTVALTVNYGTGIRETITSDNTFTRTITVK